MPRQYATRLFAPLPRHVEKALAPRETHDVLVDEEIADEAHAFDRVSSCSMRATTWGAAFG